MKQANVRQVNTGRRRALQALLSTAVLTHSVDVKATTPIRLGFSMARTGPMASATTTQFNTYVLWREQINALGGMNVAGIRRQVEFVLYDDQSKPEQAVRIYEKLIVSDKVDLLLAPWGTPFQISVAPVLERYKFPMVGNTAASVALRQIKPGYICFPTSAIPDSMGVEMVALLKTKKSKVLQSLPTYCLTQRK